MLDRATYYGDVLQYDDIPEQLGLIGRTVAGLLRHPGRTAATSLIAAATAVIVVNAAFFQSAQHPSPLFGSSAGKQQERVAQAAAQEGLDGAPSELLQDDEIGRLVQVANVDPPPVGGVAASVAVVEVQQLLAAQGYDPGLVDGLFGARTSAAIEAYQGEHGLTVTGSVSENLIAQLRVTAAAGESPVLAFADDETRLVAVQTALNQSGYGPVTANGRMTDETANAIRAFQLEYGLGLTGRADQQLIDRLVEIGALEPLQ